MGANSLTSRAGTRSQKPTGFLALMDGPARQSNPAVYLRAKTAVLFLLSTSPGCGFQSLPMARPLFAVAMDRAKAAAPPLAKSTTLHLKLQKPMRPSERSRPSADLLDLSFIARKKEQSPKAKSTY